MTTKPVDRVTVVVATRNRCQDLLLTLPRHESPVVLVDNGSTDGSPAVVRDRFAHVEVVELGRNAGATARNVGVEQARTPYVAFADDDSWWASGCLARAAEVLDACPDVALLTARVLVGTEQQPDPVSVAMAEDLLGPDASLPGPAVLGFLACAAVVRREAFLQVGGFDDVIFFGGEEEMLALDLSSAGWQMAYVDELTVHHHPSVSPDRRGRARLATRNHLLVTLMRRPWPVLADKTLRAAASGGPGVRATLSALRRAPRAIARRRPLPERVEEAKQRLERRYRPVARRSAADGTYPPHG